MDNDSMTPIVDGEVVTPEPKEEWKPDLITFPEAIKEITIGRKVSRVAWPKSDYGILKDSYLMLFIDGEFKKWLVRDGDMIAEDWFVVATSEIHD
jgi:hypothetical protein